MNASAQALAALPQLTVQPAVTFAAVPVVRVSDPATPFSELAELCCTFVVPVVADVFITLQLDDPPALPSFPARRSSDLPVVLLARIVAVAVPAAIVPVAGFAFTVIVNV